MIQRWCVEGEPYPRLRGISNFKMKGNHVLKCTTEQHFPVTIFIVTSYQKGFDSISNLFESTTIDR